MDLAFRSDGRCLLTACSDGVCIWDIEQGRWFVTSRRTPRSLMPFSVRTVTAL